MPLISEEYRQLNKQLHQDRPDYGDDKSQWSGYALNLTRSNGYNSVLDYGCGKGKLAKVFAEAGITVAEYDPAIEGKDGDPQPAELVTCCDVLEHIEPVHLNAVLRHLKELTQKRLFAVISCRPAGKTLADGRNAHLIVKPGSWWREKLADYFQVLTWEERGSVAACELVAKKHMGRLKPKARRAMTPDMTNFMIGIRDQVNAASDAFSQLSNMRMWEGFDDRPADLQGACDVLEHMNDIDEALAEFARNSLKCSFVAIKTNDLITEWDWKRVIEKRIRVAQWQKEGEHLIGIGAPGITVQGICAVGAVGDDDRWRNVEASLARITKRIETADKHDRVAVVACYGPSLLETIDTLKASYESGEVDVVSVSGSHDLLLSHGIVPKYHIECDPRPHKALNIDQSRPDVIYMVASVCHPEYFDKLGDADIRLWHVSTAEHVMRLIGEAKENPRHIISGGGSVGLRSIPLLYALGYREMHMFGLDCSFKSDGETVQQWAGKHAGKRQDVCEVLCDQELFISSPVLLTYATNFFETIQKVTDLNVRLYGRGLLQAMCKYYMSQGAMERVDVDPEVANSAERAA